MEVLSVKTLVFFYSCVQSIIIHSWEGADRDGILSRFSITHVAEVQTLARRFQLRDHSVVARPPIVR